jgi:Asp-tRNA(Asn)/Glu-tRNA(Gln) amidotransferase A subunit family amidase
VLHPATLDADQNEGNRLSHLVAWHQKTAFDAAVALQNRSLSAQAYLGACLDQIDAREPEVHAFAHVAREGAMARAKALDAGAITGAMHGLTVGVKDVFDTYDMPTQGGSRAFAGHQPIQDAAVLATLRRAGAVMLGKTVTTELATFPTNGTRNPLNLEHTPGGSSSGSAAAVAAQMVSFATGTQTMGSTVRPCGYCGVTGYKPSYNLMPRRGVWPNADSCDTVGLVARDVRDVAFFAAEMARFPALRLPEDAVALDQRPTIGLCRTHEWERTDEHMCRAFEDCARILRTAGAHVREIVLPDPFKGMLQAHTNVVHFEMSRGFADVLERQSELIRPALLERTLKGLQVTGEQYQQAQTLARQCRQMFGDVLGSCDVLLAPAATGEAPQGQDYSGDTSMNQVWTLMHGPAISVTGGYGPHQLPLAMQVVGRIDDDARTLLAAHWVHTRLAAGLAAGRP